MDIKITQQVTEALEREISMRVTALDNKYDLRPNGIELIDELVAKAIQLGILDERQKWQAAQADAQPPCIHVWRLKNGIQVCRFCGIALVSKTDKPILSIVK